MVTMEDHRKSYVVYLMDPLAMTSRDLKGDMQRFFYQID